MATISIRSLQAMIPSFLLSLLYHILAISLNAFWVDFEKYLMWNLLFK